MQTSVVGYNPEKDCGVSRLIGKKKREEGEVSMDIRGRRIIKMRVGMKLFVMAGNRTDICSLAQRAFLSLPAEVVQPKKAYILHKVVIRRSKGVGRRSEALRRKMGEGQMSR